MGRFLGLDYGRRRVGVAISDALGVTAQPLVTWQQSQWHELVDKIKALIQDQDVEGVILGFPLTLSGDVGRMAREVKRFSTYLSQRISVPVILWDERLTSVQAERSIHAMDQKPSQRKGQIDQLASVLLLQNYLDHQKGCMEKHSEGEA